MGKNKPVRKLKRNVIAPCISSLEDYKKSLSPTKHNSILGSRDEVFLKEVYSFEKNAEWRRMCVYNIHDEDFLEYVAKNDKNERVRKEAAKNSKRISILVWLKDNDPSYSIRKYADYRYQKLPNSMKFIVD